MPQALELKKLQSPLYEEFYNSLNTSCSPVFIESKQDESTPKYLKLPPKSRSPSRSPGNPSPALDAFGTGSPGSGSRGNADQRSQLNDWKGLLGDGQSEAGSPRFDFCVYFSRLSIIYICYILDFWVSDVVCYHLAVSIILKSRGSGKKSLIRSLRENEVDRLSFNASK